MSGGSSDSETTAFAVAPDGPPVPGAVITVTAVGTRAIARRNSDGWGVGGTKVMMPRPCVSLAAEP